MRGRALDGSFDLGWLRGSMTGDQALAALAVACSTLMLTGKLMHESEEAQVLIDAAAVLGALEHAARVTDHGTTL
jgi:hypothetical protein